MARQSARIAAPLLLVVVLAGSLALWVPLAGELHIAWDDWKMMAVSRELAAGRWELLLAPQDVHVFPLFRLVRAGFDLHFPVWFHWLHWVAVFFHCAAVLLLFSLATRCLDSPWAALAVAGLFGWQSLGAEAIIIKSQNAYVLSLPFLLGALYCLCRLGEGAGKKWALGCFLALAAAVGLHSLGAVAAIPGVLLGYYLLARPKGRRAADGDVAAWIACGAPFLLGFAIWLRWGGAGATAEHLFHGGPVTAEQILSRVWDGLYGTVLHFGFLVRHAPPSPLVLAAAALGLTVLLVLLKGRLSLRWVVAGLALAIPPVFLILTARGAAGYQHARYCYQSFLAVAVAAGAAVDWAVLAARDKAKMRAAILLLLAAAAPVYYVKQKDIITRKAALLRFSGTVTREFWFGWADFFDRAAERAGSAPFRLPPVELEPALRIDEAFAICNPRGKPGVIALEPAQATPADCAGFGTEVREIRKQGGAFARAPLPATVVCRTARGPQTLSLEQ